MLSTISTCYLQVQVHEVHDQQQGHTDTKNTGCTFDGKLLHYMKSRHLKPYHALQILSIYIWELLTPETKSQFPGTRIYSVARGVNQYTSGRSPEIWNLINVNCRQQSHDLSHLYSETNRGHFVISLPPPLFPSLSFLSQIQSSVHHPLTSKLLKCVLGIIAGKPVSCNTSVLGHRW